MRIGILTLPFNNNYGGLLQNYALQSYLKARGHDVYTIQQPLNRGFFEYTKRLVKKVIGVGNLELADNMKNFQKSFIQQTIPVISEVDFYKLCEHTFNIVIVGSDQVWRFNYIKQNYTRYFLDFIVNEKVKKISYAASFGVNTWEGTPEQTQTVSELMAQFHAVSVRENSGIELCANFLNRNDAIQLLDPTLLLESAAYRKLYTGNEKRNNGKIGVYFLDPTPNKLRRLSDLKKDLKKESFVIGKRVKERLWGKEYSYPSVSQWIADFDDADFIITDSFHGMVFSTIFKKKFLVIGNKERGLERFSSYLMQINQIERLIIDDSKVGEGKLTTDEIDYSEFEKMLSQNQSVSDLFISRLEV